MGNTPTKTNDREAAAVLAQYVLAIVGLQNDVPATTPIVYQQTSYTAATFVPVLQKGAAPLLAVAKARSDLKTALTNRHDTFGDSKTLIEAFFAMLPQILPPGTDPTKFGAKAPKPRTPQTAAQKAAATEKRLATRKARHIMGKKQRLAIKAPAPASPDPTPPIVPPTPGTLTPPTTSGK